MDWFLVVNRRCENVADIDASNLILSESKNIGDKISRLSLNEVYIIQLLASLHVHFHLTGYLSILVYQMK